MGVDSELILKSRDAGLRIVEVPIEISYNAPNTSKHNPVFQGLDVLSSTIKFTSLRHPLLFYGIPALILFLVGVSFGLWSVQIYLSEGFLITNITLIAVASILAGLVLGTTAIILFTVISVLRERR